MEGLNYYYLRWARRISLTRTDENGRPSTRLDSKIIIYRGQFDIISFPLLVLVNNDPHDHWLPH